MNRHYLRESDFELDAEAEADEPEPSLDISPGVRAATLWIGVPLVAVFVWGFWYGVYRAGKWLYDLAAVYVSSSFIN